MTATHCKSCGAGRASCAVGNNFACEFCGNTNVDDHYLQVQAVRLRESTEIKSLQLGMVSIAAGDFAAAEKQLEACVAESTGSAQGWVYLAYCKAALAKPSNFKRNALAARDCLQRAERLDAGEETVRNGTVLVGNKLLASSLVAARYHLATASKKHLAYSGDKGVKEMAAEEALVGLALVQASLGPEANDAELRTSVLVSTIVALAELNTEIGLVKDLDRQNETFLDLLGELAARRPELVNAETSKFPQQQKLFRKMLEHTKPAPVPIKPVAGVEPPEERKATHAMLAEGRDVAPSRSGKGRKLAMITAGAVGALVFAGWLGATLSSGSRQQVAAVSVPAPVPNSIAAPILQPVIQAPAAVASVKTAIEALSAGDNPVQQASLTLPQQAPVTVNAGRQIGEVRAPVESRDLLTQMLQRAQSAFQVSELKSAVEALPKPRIGDRRTARRLNELGLVAFRAENYPEAVEQLRQAVQADPSDVEVLNNFVYALVKAGRLQPAEEIAGSLLTNAPGRTSAWANLAEIYALTGRDLEAARALIVGFQFSSNKDKTITFLREKQTDSTSPMQNAVRMALVDIEKL